MAPKVVISSFCQSRDQINCRLPLDNLLPEITANLDQAKPGYRTGVILVPINPEPFHGTVRTLQDGDKLVGTYTPRVPGEEPRKTIQVKGKADPVVAVDAVLYSREVLAEGNENSDPTADFEVITLLTKISEEDQPMPPETLMANHFGSSGGTATQMSPEEFEKALRESYEFWKGRAQVAKPSPFFLNELKPGEFFTTKTYVSWSKKESTARWVTTPSYWTSIAVEVLPDGKLRELHFGEPFIPCNMAEQLEVKPISKDEAFEIAQVVREKIGQIKNTQVTT